MGNLRYFIFFYKCQNQTMSMYGQYGTWSEFLPVLKLTAEEIAKSTEDFSANHVNILGFNEVSKADYNNFFDTKSK